MFKCKVELADLKNRSNSNIMNENEWIPGKKEGQSQILPPKEWIEVALLELLPKKLPFVQNDTPDTGWTKTSRKYLEEQMMVQEQTLHESS